MTLHPVVSQSCPMAVKDSTEPGKHALLTRFIAGFLVVTGVTVGGISATYAFGPIFGLYIMPPSMQRYGQIALNILDEGVYASGPAWEQMRTEVEEAISTANSYDDLHPVLAKAAKIAGGKNSHLTPAPHAQSLPAPVFHTPTVAPAAGATPNRPSVTTVTMPSLGMVDAESQARYARVIADGIDQAAPSTCGYIVDVRNNSGKNMYPLLSGITALIPNGVSVIFTTREDARVEVTTHSDGAGVGGTIISVGDRTKQTHAPVAVLHGEHTSASGEAVVTALRGLSHVRTFGTPTAGHTSGSVTPRLYDGATLTLTKNLYLDRFGNNLAEKPLQPDEHNENESADEAARRWLAAKKCPSKR